MMHNTRVASSWMWSIKVGDTEAPQQAIKALRKLIHTYPNSEVHTTTLTIG